MPTYSVTTDLNCWFATCLIEYWQCLNSDGGDDAREFRDRVIEDPKAEGLAMLIDHHDLPHTFVSAIQNTVDWDYVLECFVGDTDEGDDEDDDEERAEEGNPLPPVMIDGVEHKNFLEECISAVIAEKAIDYYEPETRKCYKCFGIYIHETEEANNDDSGFCETCLKKMDDEEE